MFRFVRPIQASINIYIQISIKSKTVDTRRCSTHFVEYCYVTTHDERCGLNGQELMFGIWLKNRKLHAFNTFSFD